VTLVARRKKNLRFLWRFFWLLNSLQKKRDFSTQEFTRFLSTVSSQCWVTHSDVSFQTKQSESLVTVELTLHTYLWGRLCFIQVVCSPASRSRWATQIMSTEALFSWIIFTTNKLVVRIRKFKSNTFQNDKEKDFLAREICAAGQILHGTNGAAGKTYLIKCAAGRILD